MYTLEPVKLQSAAGLETGAGQWVSFTKKGCNSHAFKNAQKGAMLSTVRASWHRQLGAGSERSSGSRAASLGD